MSTPMHRRWFLQQCGYGLGAVAAASLAAEQALAATRPPHFAPKAKNVILLFMGGGPSQFELLDPKPKLRELDGTLPPASLLDGYRAAFIDPNSKILGPQFRFAKHGHSGAEISELLPHTAKIVDELCIIRSMQTDAFNHAPAQIMMASGSPLFGRPSLGSWVSYALGSESENLPSYVVINSGKKGPSGGAANWHSGFLPTQHCGVEFRGGGEPVLYLANPPGVDDALQRDTISALNRLNRLSHDKLNDPEIATRIASYEMAARMQVAAPELMSIAGEPQGTLDEYGIKDRKESSFAVNCLLARRMVESGVRFVQLFHESWDQHKSLAADLKQNCLETDQPAAALVADLKRRGLLDETLVIWGGEFGRTPMVQGDDGRDHHPNAFSIWMAGGGIRGGVTYGQSDELGFNVVENPVHVHDLHATILHLLGLDHTRLTYRFQGRDFRLTDVAGKVVEGII